ncbi:MAG: hypothetical protein GSR75_00385 [Desulfurococcales archaeon]|nr:hypothetical protein [Desulfurococcales archaeon]
MESLLPKVEVRLVNVEKDNLIISFSKDKQLLALLKFKKIRNSRKTNIFAHIAQSGKTLKYECKLDSSKHSCMENMLGEVLHELGIPYTTKQVSEAINGLISEWDDLVEAEELSRLKETLTLYSQPIMVIQTERDVIEVLASDGVEMPEYGSFIDLGECIAISETTYAYVKVSGKGGRELTRIEPIGILAVYERTRNGLELKDIKPYGPRHTEAVKVCDRPVRIRRAAATAVAGHTTFASLSVFNEVLEARQVTGTLLDWRESGRMVLEKLMESVYVPDKRIYYVMASYILMTYFYDIFTAIPYLWIYGPYGSGKTRANMTVTYMSRRGVMILQPSDATLYRLADAVGATIGIDESALKNNQALILAGSYKKGAAVPRAEPTRTGIILKLFESVVPRVFSFKDLPKEDYLLQRIIGILMEKGRPKKKEDPIPEEYRDIRDSLYKLRLIGLSDTLEAKAKAGEILESCGVEGREREIWWPLLTAAILAGFESRVLDYMAEDLEKRMKNEDIYVEEKTVLAAIEDLFITVRDIGDAEQRVATFMASELQNRIIRNILEEENCFEITEDNGVEAEVIKGECRKRAEELRRKWSVQKIGIVLKRLGFDKYRESKGKGAGKRRYYRVPEDAFMEKARLYGYIPDEGSAESVKSVKCLRNIYRKLETPGSASEDDYEHDGATTADKETTHYSISPENLTDSADLTDQTGSKVGFHD